MDILVTALQQGIAPAIVVAIYLIVIKLIESKKENKQAKLNADVITCVNNMNDFIKYVTKDIIEKEPKRINAMLIDTFDSFSYNLLKFIIYTLINNHIIKNKKSIIESLRKTIDKEYYDAYSAILLYNNSNNNILTSFNKDWVYALETSIIDIIYDKSLSKDQKIYQINNKIKVHVDEFRSKLVNSIDILR